MLRKLKSFFPSPKLPLYFVNFIFQRVFRLNSQCPYSVHFTSSVTHPELLKIKGGSKTLKSFAQSGGCYFSASNGIELGENVLFAPGVKIISANHDFTPLRLPVKIPPIKIGRDVWIGTNVVILPGAEIGEGSVIGGGAVVTRPLPGHCIAVGNPAKVIATICSCGRTLKPNELCTCNQALDTVSMSQ